MIAICVLVVATMAAAFETGERLALLMQKYGTDKGHHHHYYRFYEQLLSKFASRPIRLLEIGVDSGRSMAMWQEYFPDAELIVGIGYGDSFKANACGSSVQCYRGDQSNMTFLNEVLQRSGGNFDIVIDDGSHVPHHQYVSFQRLLHPGGVEAGGVYVVEDVETSYWKNGASLYGYTIQHAGVGGMCSFVEYAKSLVDVINREFSTIVGNPTERRIRSVEFSSNAVAFSIGSDDDVQRMNRPYRFSAARGTWQTVPTKISSIDCHK